MSFFPAAGPRGREASVATPWRASEAAPAAAARRTAVAAAIAAIAAIAAAALALRLLCSDGPLWVDEIWSLRNLRGIAHFWQILWGISHDNNHTANSLWLFFAAPLGENSTWLRLPSILAGALAVPVMARLGARTGAAAALAAAALTAASFFQLTYSVEARGYACATLALTVAYDALERAIDDPEGRARFVLAAAAGLGLFCHLAVGPALVLLGMIALGEIGRRERNMRRTVVALARIFWPTALAMLPAILCFLAGCIVKGGFTIGAMRPYATGHAVAAIANMAMTTLGLFPDSRPEAAFALFVLPFLVVGALVRLAPARRRFAYGVTLVGVPAAVLILHPANSHAPRYFFVLSVFLLLLAADSFAALWRFGGWRRALALAALAALLVGDAASIARFQEGKAKTWPDALTAVLASGETRLASNFDFNVVKYVDYFNLQRGANLDLVPASEICARRPAWYVVESPPLPAAPTLAIEGEGCRLEFALQRVYDQHLPSQLPWALYRRGESPSASATRP